MTGSAGPLLRDATERAIAYLDGLDERRVAPTDEAIAALAELDEQLPAVGADPAATLELLDRVGSPATMASAGGRYFGFVNGATLPGSLAAHVLASAWDQNAALAVMSPIATRLRTIVSRWMVELLGLPASTEAMFVGGATVANVCGLAAGRDHVLTAAGWDAAGDGLVGIEKHLAVFLAPDHADGQAAAQLAPGGLVADPAVEPGSDDMKLGFGHGAFESQQQTVIE